MFVTALLLYGCKDNKAQGFIIEKDSPVVNQEGILIESVGIETLGGVFTPLIQSGDKQPVSISKIFSTAADNQNQIMLRIYRGNGKMVNDVTSLGNYQVTGIPKVPRGVPQIEITFSVAGSEIKIFAKDLKTNKEISIIKI